MSYNPPGGPPPPYGYKPPHPHHPRPHPPPQAPHAPGYAYVPAPVVMPMPVPLYPPLPQPPVDPGFSQPTYVTNHYYQTPPPEPVQVAHNPPPPSDPVEWIPCDPSRAPNFSHRAVVAGKEAWDTSPLLVIRAHHSGDLIPGKLAVKNRSAYIPYNCTEIPVHNFELLCAPPHTIHWVSAKDGRVPPGAIVGGNTHNGETLYIGRAKYMRSLTPGKVHPSHGCLYISYGGNEVSLKQYEVLCRYDANIMLR